jgi:peptidyl-prolyl cis-trans isomerase D
MFDFVRRHNKTIQIFLFVLVLPSFSLLGIEGYNRYRDKGDTVASVDGQLISQADWDNAHKQQVERLRQSMPNVDVKMFDTPQAKLSTLDKLVRDRLMQVAASASHLMVSDQRLGRELQQNPTIASLYGADGKLDVARYRELLAAQQLTPEMFEARVRADLAQRQVMTGLGEGSFAPAAVADVALNAYFQQREIQWQRFNAADYLGKVSPSEDDLQAYYKDHSQQFMSQELADIEYVVFDLTAVQKSLTVTDADLRSFYEQNQARLAQLQERRVSHILIESPASASAADRAKAKARAQELLAELKKTPEKFAEYARKYSQDHGSADKGGDLDFVTRGAMVKPFEDAAFALNKGELSQVVETEFGYHILRVTDIRSPAQKTFEESRASLEVDARRQLAQRKFAEEAETFTNTVYEQADSLKPVADALKLEIKSVKGLTREQGAMGNSLVANPKVLAAIFSPDALESKRNTSAIELGANQLIAARVVQYSPAHLLNFDEVKSRVRELVQSQQATQRARTEGEARLAELKKQGDAAISNSVMVSREQKLQLPSEVVEAALRANTKTLPAWVGVDLGAAGYAVVKVQKVVERDAAQAQNRDRERAQYAQWWASAESLAYYNLLKEKFKVQMKAKL